MTGPPSRLRIIVTGLVGLNPVGGVVWDYLQYVQGFAKLGHDVYYHEDTWTWPYHPLEAQRTSDASYSATCLSTFFEQYAPELQTRWHYRHLHETSFGLTQQSFSEIARTADLFLNVSGACMIPEELSSRCLKIFLDTDPGYNQMMLSERFAWSENVERWCRSVADHDLHFTYAENILADDCIIPKSGYNWRTTRMPVVLEAWRSFAESQPPAGAPWTTVMTWNAFGGKVVYQGVEYGSKGTEFAKLNDLPSRLDLPFTIAVGGIGAPLTELAAQGWDVRDGPRATLTPGMYQAFIAASKGEVSPAKHVYVATRSGWFSCRSACYLAAGRPVVVQDTGFSRIIPSGHGLLAFTDRDDAVEAIKEAEGNYSRHSKAARSIANEYFDSSRVLEQLLGDVFR